MTMFDRNSYRDAGSAGGRGADLFVGVRVFMSNEDRDLVQVTAGGWDAEDAISWAEEWAAKKYDDETYSMDEWEAA